MYSLCKIKMSRRLWGGGVKRWEVYSVYESTRAHWTGAQYMNKDRALLYMDAALKSCGILGLPGV